MNFADFYESLNEEERAELVCCCEISYYSDYCQTGWKVYGLYSDEDYDTPVDTIMISESEKLISLLLDRGSAKITPYEDWTYNRKKAEALGDAARFLSEKMSRSSAGWFVDANTEPKRFLKLHNALLRNGLLVKKSSVVTTVHYEFVTQKEDV